MEVIRLTCHLNSIRGEAPNLSNGLPSNPKPPPPLYVSKPSWVVRTESNVRKERRKLPDPPCVVCKGNGRGKCYHCHGRGRTNFVDLEVLPRGEWPKWCKTCGGSGLGYCSRCLGTGEYRYIMGFHFMRQEVCSACLWSIRGRLACILPQRLLVISVVVLLVGALGILYSIFLFESANSLSS